MSITHITSREAELLAELQQVKTEGEKDLMDMRRFQSLYIAADQELRSFKQQEPTAHYGIIDPDYARVYTQARIIAWQYGYACVMHGSFTRDLDLLLVPWTEQARDNHDQLLKLIAQACGLRFRDGLEEVYKSTVDWSDKPHGRKACSLFFPGFNDRRWVDISVMPCLSAAMVQP